MANRRNSESTPATAHRDAVNADIEVLRGIAVLLVVVCHIATQLVSWPGRAHALLEPLRFWGGVDLFFAISGFVVASSLLREPRPEKFRDLATPFYIRRIFRIWPVALLWLLVPVLAAHFFNSSGVFGHTRFEIKDATAAALQVANAYFVVCHHDCGKESVYWSLSLEEQFYLLFPLLLFWMRPKHLWWLLVGIVLVQFFIPRPVESGLWFFRTDAISLGVLIALARHHGIASRLPSVLAAWPRWSLLLPLALLAAICAVSAESTMRPAVGVLALLSAACVWLASFDANLVVPWKPARNGLMWLGSRSFAVYLTHVPCFWATRELFHRLYPHTEPDDRFALPYLLVALSLIAVTSEASYRLLETPLRERGRGLAARWRKARAARAIATSIATDH